MSKVTRDGIVRTLAGASDSEPSAELNPGIGRANATPPPRKRLDLNATIALSEDALAALLEEVKGAAGSGDDNTAREDEDDVVAAPALPPLSTPTPARPIVPASWQRLVPNLPLARKKA